MSSFKLAAQIIMSKVPIVDAKRKSVESAPSVATKREPPSTMDNAHRHRKKGPQNPGKDLTMKEKTTIFTTLEQHHPITAGDKTGEPIPSAAELYKSTNLKPDVDLAWSSTACFDNSALFLVRDGWLDKYDLRSLAQVDPHYEALVTSVPALTNIDFSTLRNERLDYSTQKVINPERVIKLTACAVHFGLDFGLVVRYINDETTAKHRDPVQVEQAIGPHVDPADMAQIVRILTKGCPAQLKFELPKDHKMRMLRRGNQKSILDHDKEIRETMNKEEKHSHIVPFLPFVCRFANTAQCVPQGMILKIGSDPRIVWDGSTKLEPDDIVMNDHVPLDSEAPITFGRCKGNYIAHIYNTRASYPHDDIDLAAADIKCAHRYPRVAPDLAAAFGFLIQGMYFFISTAMVFGSIISASSWEPFRRAIEVMTSVYSLRHDLVEKHTGLLSLVVLEPPSPPGTTFVRATICPIVTGVIDETGNQMPIPNFIYVDDCLLACVRAYTTRMLAGCIEAIFVVLGFPNLKVRQSHLAMNKWIGTHVGHRVVQIGLVFDSRKMTVGMTAEYLHSVWSILNDEWKVGATQFSLQNIVTLAGKLARLGEAAPWIYHLMSHIYASIAFALRYNETFLMNENGAFRSLIGKIKALRLMPKVKQDLEHMNFYVKKGVNLSHPCGST